MLELYENKEYFEKLSKGACTYNALYGYWREQLFERVMRLFVWEGTEEVQPKEIEQRLIIAGHCGITRLPREKELTAMFGAFFGVTKYFDEWKNYTVHCPIYAGTRVIGKNVAIISNNAERNAVLPLIHHYAQLLAHAEVSFIDVLINARDNNGIPIVLTEKQKQSVMSYQAQKFNGQYGVIADPSALGVNYTQASTLQASLFKEMWETRNNILKEFYSDIGIKAAFDKKSNTIDAEVKSDNSLLLLNIKDMLDYRKRGCDDVNALYGTNWSVKVSDEINYKLVDVVGANDDTEVNINEND